MRKETALLFLCLTTALLFLLNTPVANCQELPKDIILKVWTDKPYYKPGDTGKLFITIMNNYEEAGRFIENITVTYPWWPSYIDGEWVGTDVIVPSDAEKGLELGDVYTTEVSFKVPSDGRAKSGNIRVEAFFAGDDYRAGTFFLNVDTTPPSRTEGINTLANLLALQIILTVVSALIVAAAVYFSLRKGKKPSSNYTVSPPSPPTPPPTESGETTE